MVTLPLLVNRTVRRRLAASGNCEGRAASLTGSAVPRWIAVSLLILQSVQEFVGKASSSLVFELLDH